MFRARSIVSLACAVAAVGAAGAPAAADAQRGKPAKGTKSECGPKIAKSTGGQWQCTFADDFQGAALDRTKWSVMTTATTGFTHAWECYVDDPSTVAVANGSLNLTARKLAEPASCGSLFQTPYLSGMVHTKDSFAQTYGRFEARVKFAEGSGLHSAWWMWPRDMAYGAQSGEIDIAEHWGMYPSIVSPYAHIKHTTGAERGRGEYCNVANPGGSFHSYAVEWTPPGHMVFLYDGEPCMTFENWDPGDPLTYPQPFDQPFFMILTLALQYGAVNQSTPFPATMSVDYVRAWS